MTFHIDMRSGHIDNKSLYQFGKFVIAPASNSVNLKYIVPLSVLLQITVHVSTWQ
jgi:hypothetical protein